ncbi:hypothetical protein XELAEV_18014006mg [Xenopus laevis]|uniref:Uncharacterized protein n=1 Tax=Xenopus laevis TaxID=8355 RepID=A0A974DRT4_XENLA|nr:hypothetical protein XELAEV_18014006mg [Xenopus laevis]
MHCERNPIIQCSRCPFVECHSLGNSCYPCTHPNMSSYLHLFGLDITVAARIALWQDGCCPGLNLHSCH